MNDTAVLAAYLEEKPAHPRTIQLIERLNINFLRRGGVCPPYQYIASFVEQTHPSVQSFRIFIDKLCDFSDLIHSDTYNKEEFDAITDRRTPIHKDIDAMMADIGRIVDVKNKDNFETSQLQWHFTTNSVDDLKDTIKKLESVVEKVEKLYDLC